MTNLRFANEISRLLVFALCRRRRPSVPALRTACARAFSPSGLRRAATGTGKYFSVSHRSSIQHGRTTALASSLVALPASLGLLRAVSRTARALRAPLAFGGAVFRVFAPPCASLARCSGTAAALWACPRASSRFAAFDCALRFASCARHFSPSGLHLFASICIHSSQSSICIARKLACSSRCSLGSLRPVSFLNSQ